MSEIKVRLLAFALFFASCSSGEVSLAPKMEIDPPTLTVSIDESSMEDGQTYTYILTVLNTGYADLVLSEPSIEQSCSLFDVKWQSGIDFPYRLPPTKTKLEGLALQVVFTKSSSACEKKRAVLHIKGNDISNPQIDVTFEVVSTPPSIAADDVEFGYVPEGTVGEANLYVQNQGKGLLFVHRVTFQGSPAGFSFQWPCERAQGQGSPSDWIQITEKVGVIGDSSCDSCDVKCAKPIAVKGGSGQVVPLRFGAICDPDPSKKCPPEAEARMTLFSNDPTYNANAGEGKVVKITANKGGKCIQALNSPINFGSIIAPNLVQKDLVLFGCGDKDVTISDISVVEANPPPSAFSYAMPAGKSLPYVLKPNEKLSVAIRYQPTTTHKDVTGAYQEDTAKLLIANDSPVPELKVPLSGLPVDAQCAVADFKAIVGSQVLKDKDTIAVQSTIKLKQDCYDLTPGGGIVSYEWKVKTSTTSTESVQPNPFAPNVTYEANVVGTYDISLECCNKFGCCQTKTMQLEVPPPEGCHVELTWNTPLDPDQTDQCGTGLDCGSDMDLHVVHPAASGPDLDKDGKPDGFFDVGQYGGGFAGDCMWFNPRPCWIKDKCSDPNYQPSLDRDDTDGAGPENFTYRFPEVGKCYKVGVHYWDDHKLGKSYPTVRIWVDDVKVYENSTSPAMSALDMWEVGEICCTDKTFKEYKTQSGGLVIIHNYVNPDFNFTP